MICASPKSYEIKDWSFTQWNYREMVGLWGSGTGLEVFWSSECMPLKEILGPCSLKFLTLFLIHCEFKFVPLLLSTNLCCLNRNQGGLIPCDPCLAPQKVRGRVNTSSYNLSQVWHHICRKWMYSLFYTFLLFITVTNGVFCICILCHQGQYLDTPLVYTIC